MYKHLTLEERFRIEALIKEDFEIIDIAERLGRNESSICREIRRNSNSRNIYIARITHKKARLRRKLSKQSARIIENNPKLGANIEKLLDPLTSPETIVQEPEVSVCFETIYAWIRRSRPDLKQKLPYRGKKRRKYGTKRAIKQGWTNKVRDIEERPLEVETRAEILHWEGDTVHGVNGNLLTYSDRKSRFEKVVLIKKREAYIVYEETQKMFKNKLAKTFTYDRGSEFSLWKMIEKSTGTKVFFAKPHHPWQRGTNENSNGRLRRIFPKKFDFNTIKQKDIDAVVWKMNHTKRKCLNWRTPCEVFGACCISS